MLTQKGENMHQLVVHDNNSSVHQESRRAILSDGRMNKGIYTATCKGK
jgi:hypothetical protein